MKLALLASLATSLTATAAFARRLPEPMPPTPMPPMPGAQAAKTCHAAGLPLFQIRQRSEVKGQPTSTTSIYSNGAWTFRPVDKDGKAGALTTGCLAKDDLKTVRASIRSAPWTITHQRIACLAYSPTYTEYVVRGRLKFHAQMCNGDVLDETSRASIAAIEAVLPKH
jgi:hypothetical protein